MTLQIFYGNNGNREKLIVTSNRLEKLFVTGKKKLVICDELLLFVMNKVILLFRNE